MSHYADESVFRTSNGSEFIEFLPPRRGASGVVVVIDSYDAPEASIRLSTEASAALVEWLSAHVDVSD